MGCSVTGKPHNVTLTIVREQGFVGDVAVHYRTRPALSQLPKNQATANEDYILKDAVAVMKENVTDITITITILPVSLGTVGDNAIASGQ